METETTRSSNLTPRLLTSRQWTELPAELIQNLQKIFREQFKPEAEHGDFLFEGRIYPEELVMRIGYLEKGRLKQINFEASIDLPKPEGRTVTTDSLGDAESVVMQRLYSCLDALGGLMEEYFALGDEEEMEIPEKWQPFEFEGEIVYLQRSTYNSKLEEEADRLLGLADKQLVHDENSRSEDALANAEVNSELAFEIQKAIRSGKYPRRDEEEPDGTLDC